MLPLLAEEYFCTHIFFFTKPFEPFTVVESVATPNAETPWHIPVCI